MTYQFLKRGDESWDVYAIVPIECGPNATGSTYEVVARVSLDKIADRYYVEVPQWKEKGNEMQRLSRTYLTTAAAFRSITNPPRRS